MEVTITFHEKLHSKETLRLENLLCENKFPVYLINSHVMQTKYALKVFPNTTLGLTHYEKDSVSASLQHPNIIKNTPITCENDNLLCLMTELAPYGDFLSLAMSNVVLSETLIRTYFHQLIEGIEYLHSQGIAHLDLKLDNLVLGSDYKLKIIDFDQAQSIRETKMKCGGSSNYRPPEVIDKRCKNLSAVDIYSAGIILYTLIAQEFPFCESTDSKGVRLQHYSTFVKDKTKFWAMKASRKQNSSVFSEELIELLNGMFEYDAQKRMNLDEIKNSKWYQGAVFDEENLIMQMN